MKNQSSYRNGLADAFRMPSAPTLVTRAIHRSTMAVTELRCDLPNFGKTTSIPREDAYLIALQLRPCADHDLYFDGRLTRPENFVAGVTTIFDLRRDPIADLRDPFHSLMFHLPRKTLDAIASEAGTQYIRDLRHRPGVSVDDPVVRHLLSALLPAMATPEQAHPLFLDHVALALAAHVAQVYGGMDSPRGLFQGGLAPAQERRVKELMSANLSSEITLNELAAECGLSVRHFARAFRKSTGVPPHRWLLKHRVERARDLLGNRALSLSEIALSCGFSDQSHFTRVFTAMIGLSPGTWRRHSHKVKINPV